MAHLQNIIPAPRAAAQATQSGIQPLSAAHLLLSSELQWTTLPRIYTTRYVPDGYPALGLCHAGNITFPRQRSPVIRFAQKLSFFHSQTGYSCAKKGGGGGGEKPFPRAKVLPQVPQLRSWYEYLPAPTDGCPSPKVPSPFVIAPLVNLPISLAAHHTTTRALGSWSILSSLLLPRP